MNLNISKININLPKVTFRSNENKPFITKPLPNDSFELSVGYVNDIHGQTNNMMRILSGIKGDLKLSAGDNDIGDEKNKPVHNATVKFLNMAEIKATVLGNHEIDANQKDVIDTMKSFNGDVLACNFNQEDIEDQELEDIKKLGRAQMDEILKNSTIVEVKGEKIGIIGACPMDMMERLTHPNYYTDCSIEDLEDTIEIVQEEIDELREKGINKIILLSHMGPKRDKVVAENTEGLDVILSGHTHELIKDIKEGENLIYSKTGEPVIITEAGRDGNYFGLLNLTFDKDGVITKAQNNIAETRLFHKNMINQFVFDKILGKPEVVGNVIQAPPPPKSLDEENPHANFACDIMKEKTNSDIALWHNCGVRNFFHEGFVDSSDIKDMSPFLDYVVTANVSEKTIVDLFKHAIEATYNHPAKKPGLFAVAGLEYSVNPNEGTLTSMTFIDKNGNKHSINVENPREDKFYKVVTDEFLMSAGADFDKLVSEEEWLEKFPYDKDYLVCEYLKEHPEPIVIDHFGRLSFDK